MAGKKGSYLEEMFEEQLREAGITRFEREVKAIPKRRFRVDFVIYPWRLAVEIEGGIWLRDKGRHTNPVGFQRDCEKYNLLAMNGYSLLRFTTKHVTEGTALALTLDRIKQLEDLRKCSNFFSVSLAQSRVSSLTFRAQPELPD